MFGEPSMDENLDCISTPKIEITLIDTTAYERAPGNQQAKGTHDEGADVDIEDLVSKMTTKYFTPEVYDPQFVRPKVSDLKGDKHQYVESWKRDLVFQTTCHCCSQRYTSNKYHLLKYMLQCIYCNNLMKGSMIVQLDRSNTHKRFVGYVNTQTLNLPNEKENQTDVFVHEDILS